MTNEEDMEMYGPEMHIQWELSDGVMTVTLQIPSEGWTQEIWKNVDAEDYGVMDIYVTPAGVKSKKVN